MALVPDQKFSTFQNGGDPTTGDIIVGLRGGINTKFNWVIPPTVDTIMGTANQVLVNGSAGVPVLGDVTLSTPQDIGTTSSPTFANLTLTGSILGTNGLPVLTITSLASAVNWLSLNNQVTGVNPGFVATGTDTDVGIGMVTKGAGFYTFASASTGTTLQWQTGTSYQHLTNFIFPNTAATRNITFPDDSGTVALTSGASGIVNPGLINQLGYYAAAGTTISGLATANNGVLVTSSGGVPSISTTLPSGLTIPGYAHSGANTDITSLTGLTGTLAAPTAVTDSLGNVNLGFIYAASAVNYINSFNSATGVPLGFSAAGTDANIIFRINSKGNAPFVAVTASTNIPFQMFSGTGSQHLTGFSFSDTAASRVVTFPDADFTVATAGANANITSLVGLTGVIQAPTFINDSNGNNLVGFTGTASAANYLNITNAILGGLPQIAAVGGSTNISMQLIGKGTGGVAIFGHSGGTIPFSINNGTAYQHQTLFAFANTSAVRTVTFPDADGTVAFTSSASGIVNSGLINQLAWYAASGTTVSGLATAASGVLVTSAGSVPSISTTLPSGLTIPGYATSGANANITSLTGLTGVIQAPTFINDSLSAHVLGFTSSGGTPVNYVNITNAITGTFPAVGAAGSDTNIALNLVAKGNGLVQIFGSSGSTTPLIIYNGTSYQHNTIFLFSNTSASRVVTFPDATGTVAFQADSTWTPVLSFGGASVGITYAVQAGNYTRIGNTVTFTLQVQLTNKGSSTGAASITLPIAQRAGTGFTSFSIIPGILYAAPTVIAYGSPSSTAIGLQTYSTAAVAVTLTDTAFTNTSIVIISGSYLV